MKEEVGNIDPSLSRVILIGGSGFIGNAIEQELLKMQVTVLNIGSRLINLIDANAELQLKATLKKTDSIVMLAALTPDHGKDSETFLKNIQMLDVVLRVVSDINPAHFVYFSSDAVYGSQEVLISEESSLNPTDLYGAMHLTRELMLTKISHVPTMILRPTIVYGKRDTHNAYGPNRFLRMAKDSNEIVLFGKGEELRDYIAVEDVASITRLILQKKISGVLNLATGYSLSFELIANLIEANRKYSVSIRSIERVNKIFHRHFNISNLIRMFPGHSFKKLEDYLRTC